MASQQRRLLLICCLYLTTTQQEWRPNGGRDSGLIAKPALCPACDESRPILGNATKRGVGIQRQNKKRALPENKKRGKESRLRRCPKRMRSLSDWAVQLPDASLTWNGFRGLKPARTSLNPCNSIVGPCISPHRALASIDGRAPISPTIPSRFSQQGTSNRNSSAGRWKQIKCLQLCHHICLSRQCFIMMDSFECLDDGSWRVSLSRIPPYLRHVNEPLVFLCNAENPVYFRIVDIWTGIPAGRSTIVFF